ncbi:Glycolipid 2-alpha-mannosyltransferase 1 [Cyberlindnera fabianii]|uniref:Glycolipid 2-alpha-mannosyltransferase 1 n=1 Tax=Cyberlindnera fabianii TaxID=36022 RepID=A0A1V2L8Q5_CYBFA|nr:Glycolipid 2-alpha-mannosyltransferase 1 [Cyberlindnera fabianii]
MLRVNERFIKISVFALFILGTISVLSRSSGPQLNFDSTNAATTAISKGFSSDYQRENATFVSLARNDDLWELANAVRSAEDRFNLNYHYDWVFLNDEPFSDEFKTVMTRLVSGTAKFGVIPKEHWSYPDFIDQQKAAETRTKMKNIIYGSSESYRHMCRYESGFFYRHPLMMEYKYYWRVEPSIKFHCDISYDVFKFMREQKKDYGFTITIHEFRSTIETLWDTTLAFMEKNPETVHPDNLLAWISDDNGKNYNLCHFWSNFEIGNMDFWRGEAYSKYFDFLDKAGGFFYERWGDAPVHSIAAALFLPKDRIHYFEEIGYYHNPYNSCPINDKVRIENNCVCDPNNDFTWNDYSCTKRYFDVRGFEKPAGWEKHTG